MNTTSYQPSPKAAAPKRRPYFLPVLVGAVLVAGLLIIASHRGQAAPSSAAAVPAGPKVTVAPVEEQSIAEYDEITGHVDATETVDLRARVSGHLDSVHFQAGQIVKEGELLFTIDPRWYQAQFDLATARSDVARREAKRADELLAATAISSEEAEARRARFAEAQAELATARLDLEHTEVRAPITGRIGRALITKGNLVSGSPGDATLLTTIVSVGEAYVYADIDEATFLRFDRYARSHRGEGQSGRVPVDLELADEGGYPRHGFVESSDNRLNAETGSLTLRMIFPNLDGALVPGLFARRRPAGGRRRRPPAPADPAGPAGVSRAANRPGPAGRQSLPQIVQAGGDAVERLERRRPRCRARRGRAGRGWPPAGPGGCTSAACRGS